MASQVIKDRAGGLDFSNTNTVLAVAGVAAVAFAAGAAASPFVSKALKRLLASQKPAAPSLNSDKSGARFERDLARGKHDIQVYTMSTPNGQKVPIALEEMGLPYDAYQINIHKGDQFSSGFVAVNPNSKIPAIVDKRGPGGREVRVFESGAILLYLAEKSGKLLPKDPLERQECICWVFFQTGAGPFFGQYGHFARFAPERIEYAVARYSMESQRIMDVLEKRLVGREYLVGNDLTIADVMWFPYVNAFDVAYKAREILEMDKRYPNLMRWVQRIGNRPAVKKGIMICKSDGPYVEYHSE